MPQASMAFTALGQAQAEEGSLDDALATVEEGLILRRRNPARARGAMTHHLLVSARVCPRGRAAPRAQELVTEASGRMARFQEGAGPMSARLNAIQGDIRAARADGAYAESLTDRELDVLRLLQGSLSLPEIAAELHLSANTVKTHTYSVYRKLGAHTRTDAVRIGRQNLLI